MYQSVFSRLTCSVCLYRVNCHLIVCKSAIKERDKFTSDDERTSHIHIVGKRQAKKYIRKALSFGVRSGYLIPTDRKGSVLRVCPTLDTQWRSTDTEARQRRRIARRGKTHLTTVADRKAMRRGIPRDKCPLHNDDDRRMASKRKTHRTQLARSSARNLNTRENTLRKLPGKSIHDRNKSKAFTRNSRLFTLF